MEAKYKAIELVDKYNDEELFYLLTFRQAKECALIAVNEIINMCSEFTKEYWQEVKQEIIKL